MRSGISDDGMDRFIWGITGKKPERIKTVDHPKIRSVFADAELLHLMWDYLDASLQDAFALAYTKKKRAGKDRISTRDLFQALVRINDPSVSQLFNTLPEGALPKPIDNTITKDDSVLTDSPLLSNCVAESLTYYESFKSQTRKVSQADLFVDIGKNGTGPSVRRLREHGVNDIDIQDRVNDLGMVVMARD